ncbi:hypothetical protein MNBD_NITROSPINAE05-1190 [hydrothermal vent metagenome]|uniref:Uncharacterized protein n=1 Tax=hydrothermal vent metagenome TaxID=652676 RepID=A0A3B1CTP5_9ZZZZ
MIGAIEIMIIAIIFGIVYGRDAIDKSYRKHPDESVMESFAEDVKEYYHTDPKRLVKLGIFFVSVIAFLCLGGYLLVTRTDLLLMLGMD